MEVDPCMTIGQSEKRDMSLITTSLRLIHYVQVSKSEGKNASVILPEWTRRQIGVIGHLSVYLHLLIDLYGISNQICLKT